MKITKFIKKAFFRVKILILSVHYTIAKTSWVISSWSAIFSLHFAPKIRFSTHFFVVTFFHQIWSGWENKFRFWFKNLIKIWFQVRFFSVWVKSTQCILLFREIFSRFRCALLVKKSGESPNFGFVLHDKIRFFGLGSFQVLRIFSCISIRWSYGLATFLILRQNILT
jgi:hypothetical protein